MLKLVKTPSKEIELGQYLSSGALRDDKRNHSIPLLDFFPDPFEPTQTIAVLPVLRRISRPPLASVRECIDFVQQTLEARSRNRSARGLLTRTNFRASRFSMNIMLLTGANQSVKPIHY